MSATVHELQGELRKRAAQKRTVAFENFTKQAKPQTLAAALLELADILKAMRELLAAQGNSIEKAGPVKFKAIERDFAGNVTSFEAER